MKLVDKPLTERQKTFANLYVLHAGSVSRTKIAIEAGYLRDPLIKELMSY